MSQSILPERFWRRVVRLKGKDGCWLFVNPSMWYGSFTISGRMYQAHRLTYMDAFGPIPEGLELDHLCRTPPCVRPDHLEPVTHAENTRRGYEARRTPGFYSREKAIQAKLAPYRYGAGWREAS